MRSRKITLPQPTVHLKQWRLDGQIVTGTIYNTKSPEEFPDGTTLKFNHILYTVQYPAGMRGKAFQYARSAGGIYIKLFDHDAEGFVEPVNAETAD